MSSRLCLFNIGELLIFGFQGAFGPENNPGLWPRIQPGCLWARQQIKTRCYGFCMSSYICPEMKLTLTGRLLPPPAPPRRPAGSR